jgi:transcriptional regulator with XRE-family HTH domain
MADRMPTKTVRETVADNVRGFRQLRGIDQAVLARRMEGLGYGWRQVTVSEVERDQRNVTVAELLGLAFTLETTIEQLLDPRGPERARGPWLSFAENDPDHRRGTYAIPGTHVVNLVCTHALYPIVQWDDDEKVNSLTWATEDQQRASGVHVPNPALDR